MFGVSLGAVGSVLSPALNYASAAAANRTNRAIASNQMDFQAEQSSTAYQRSMADMKAAGLNPMLAYQQGGASSPPGASAAVQPENFDISSAVNNYYDNQKKKEEVQSLDSQQKLNSDLSAKARAETVKALSDTDVALANAKSQVELNSANAVKSRAEARLLSSKFSKASLESSVYDGANWFFDQLKNSAKNFPKK